MLSFQASVGQLQGALPSPPGTCCGSSPGQPQWSVLISPPLLVFLPSPPHLSPPRSLCFRDHVSDKLPAPNPGTTV